MESQKFPWDESKINSWADEMSDDDNIEENSEYVGEWCTIKNFSKSVNLTNEYKDPYEKTKPIDNISYNSVVNKKREKKKRQSENPHKCYTCNPKGKVEDHIITKETYLSFHHDMWKRPYIIATLNTHKHSFNDMNKEELFGIFKDIQKFTDDWNIRDYCIINNNGHWQTHYHFHIKIKISEKVIQRMRRDHFTKKKLDKNYEIN